MAILINIVTIDWWGRDGTGWECVCESVCVRVGASTEKEI
jgi:hypothetical protein